MRYIFSSFSQLLPESSPGLLSNVINALEKQAYEVHHTTYKVSFQPILSHLTSTKEMWTKWNTEARDLPDYSYSPLEYITQVSVCYLGSVGSH